MKRNLNVNLMEPYKVIKKPHVSEKSHEMVADSNTYVFKVDSLATKLDISNAVAKIWNVKVKAVRTINVPGKRKRMGKIEGYSSCWKKAIVELAEGQGIDVLR